MPILRFAIKSKPDTGIRIHLDPLGSDAPMRFTPNPKPWARQTGLHSTAKGLTEEDVAKIGADSPQKTRPPPEHQNDPDTTGKSTALSMPNTGPAEIRSANTSQEHVEGTQTRRHLPQEFRVSQLERIGPGPAKEALIPDSP